MAVIVVSRSFASGGRELGRLLARRLGYHYVDKSLFQKIAQDLDVSEGTLESFEQGREYRVSNLFSNLFSKNYIQRIVGYDKTVVEETEYQESLRKLILGVAKEDGAVIIGRGAHYFLREMENCYCFRLIASLEWRTRYAVEKLGLSLAQAQKVLDRKDKNQAWFHRLVCGEGYDDQLLFNLILNMGLVSVEKAAAIVLSVLGK
jgi:cytidylate kinase